MSSKSSKELQNQEDKADVAYSSLITEQNQYNLKSARELKYILHSIGYMLWQGLRSSQS